MDLQIKWKLNALNKIVRRLKGNPKTTGYTHDQDLKLIHHMSHNWNITEFIDPNHANKSYYNWFHSYNKRILWKDIWKKAITKYRYLNKLNLT